MRQVSSLNHTRWECKYHIVFIPEYRKKTLFGQTRRELGEVFHSLARQKESLIEEGHLMISIPPKYAVSQVIGFIKGKSAIHIARRFSGRQRNYGGQHFWARGYFASTVGRDEAVIRAYIQHQEKEDQRLEQLRLM